MRAHSISCKMALAGGGPSATRFETPRVNHDARPRGIGRTVEAIAGEPAGGLIVMPDSFTMSHRETIVTLTARYRVPTATPFGCLPPRAG
jgi:hypothetical protein